MRESSKWDVIGIENAKTMILLTNSQEGCLWPRKYDKCQPFSVATLRKIGC